MTRSGWRRAARVQLTRTLGAVGVLALLGGSTLVATGLDVAPSAAATTTLRLTTTAAGASCNDSNPAAPVCSGLANGDVLTVSGTGFSPGATASIVQCNSDPSQPVVLFLGQDIPVSCSALALTSIPASGKTKGDLNGTQTMRSGTVGPPVAGTPTCKQTSPTTSVITGCSTSGSGATDAKSYPCPPTADQQAAGDTCVVAIGDTAGDRAIGTVLFGSETLPTSTTTTKPGSSTTTSSTTTSSTSSTTTSSTTTSSTSTTTTSSTTTTTPTTSVTTSRVSEGSIDLSPSGTVSDAVDVQGTSTYGSPTGTVTFYVCQTGTTQTLSPGPCAADPGNELDAAHVVAAAGDGATAASSAFTPTGAGTWCFSAVYASSSAYTGSADNTGSSNLDPDECVLVTSAPSSTLSFVSAADVVLGPDGTVNDSVTVGGGAQAGSPTGAVAFYVCRTDTSQTLTPGPCVPTAPAEDAGEVLVPGAGDTSSATSASFTPTGAGTWCFSAVYGGDANYAGSSDNAAAADVDPDQCVLVLSASSATASTVSSATVALGSSGKLTDSVTVTGDAQGGPPTGDVAFYVCQTGTTPTLTPGPCAATGTPEDAGAALGAGSGATASATSAAFTPTALGTWCFSAVYGGDANYTGSDDDTAAADLDPAECVLVTSAPVALSAAASLSTLVLGAGTTFTDAVTVTGNAVAGTPTGTVTFLLCGPLGADASCQSGGAAEGSPGVTGTGATATARSDAVRPTVPGIYCFSASYGPAAGSDYRPGAVNVTGAAASRQCVRVEAPFTITSSTHALGATGKTFAFTVTTAGSPPASVTKHGALPKGLTFVNFHNGSAKVSGTPKKAGIFHLTWTATFGAGKSRHVATQSFTLSIVS